MLQRGQQPGQLLGGVRAVGVHLDDDVVAVLAGPGEAGDVGRARGPALPVAVQHVHPRRRRRPAGRRSRPVPSGLLSSTTSRCAVGTAASSRCGDGLEVVPLVVRRDDRRAPGRAAASRARPAPTPAPSAEQRRAATARARAARRRRVASVSAARAVGTSPTSTSRVKTGAAADDRAVGGDDGADAAGGGDQHRAAVLDGAQPAHGQLLLGLAAPTEGRVVGLHDQQPAPSGHDVAHQPVVGHLEADDVTEPDRPDVEHARRRRRRRSRAARGRPCR